MTRAILALAWLAAVAMASSTQCGFGRAGCLYGWHDCDLSPQHRGRHRCGSCGQSFS